MIPYFIISVGLIISVAVIQIPVGGAAAGVPIAKCEKINKRRNDRWKIMEDRENLDKTQLSATWHELLREKFSIMKTLNFLIW